MSGEVPGKLKSPHIIRRSTASVPILVRSKPTSSKNNDLLEGGGLDTANVNSMARPYQTGADMSFIARSTSISAIKNARIRAIIFILFFYSLYQASRPIAKQYTTIYCTV